ncbi:antibiotic biosynthesis monooxygenase [Streptomyces sp. NK15101]|uniref:antibiotic biosynthesis monooxygenase n=1 Tax=Streptomyces sp. NK15101 TaxID=2873261 RepID=UPI001CECDE04|nr:antibiotic biosynthesis monooxygenase [Streptomyces sp. NK15101]
MYVRTIYAIGDPAKIDTCVDALREEAPRALAGQPGYRGFALFTDRELGKVLTGSWWESEQALRSSDDQLKERRATMLAPFADTVTVDGWEAAVFTPPAQVGPDAGFRLTRFEIAPSDAGLLVETFRDVTLPKLQAIPGFETATMLLDRARGRGGVGVLYADQAALAASRGKQSAARGETVTKTGVSVCSLEEFEVVMLERR